MKHPVQWEFDLSDFGEAADTITDALQARGAMLTNYRSRLMRCRDKIGEAVDAFAHAGLDAAYENCYLQMFDALAFLTEALRGRSIGVFHLDRARTAMWAVIREGGES